MTAMNRGFRITFGGWMLLSLLCFFLDYPSLLVLLGNVYVHEMGHLWMLRRMGVYVREIALSGTGLCIVCNTAMLSSVRLFLCAMAGPLFGLVSAVIVSAAANLGDNDFLRLFAGAGVILSVFNLMPVAPLDGYRMLRALAPRLAPYVCTITALLMLAVGLWLMVVGYGTSFAFLGLFLVIRDIFHVRFA